MEELRRQAHGFSPRASLWREAGTADALSQPSESHLGLSHSSVKRRKYVFCSGLSRSAGSNVLQQAQETNILSLVVLCK